MTGRADPPPGMVERRGASLWFTHVLMILGVLVIAFPIWLAFVASTVPHAEISQPPMPLLPGPFFWVNYRETLVPGVNPVATMLFNSLVMAIGNAVGKIVISLISAFATSILAMIPPPVVVVFRQKLLIRGRMGGQK